MTVRNTSPSIALQSVAGEKNLGLYVSEYPGSFSVSLPIYLLDYLSAKLTDEFGKGFDKSNIRKMRQFYCTFPIRDTLCLELSWSHYHLLIRVADEQTRTFYVEECLRSVWSVRQLERQIGTMYYQRINKSNRVSGFSPIPCYSSVPSMALILLVKVQSRVFTAKCSEPQVGTSNGMDEGSGVTKFLSLRTET